MDKRNVRKKKRRTKNTGFIIFMFALILIAAIYFALANRSLDNEIKKLDSDLSSNQKKLEDLDVKIKELEKDYEMRNTDEFKEKIAEERLGMVKEKTDESDEDKGSN
ncbi:FtsB family cell division protein [Anaerococcus sp. Marseille-P9784]|uniref:FtsB family cell division protein n=1 Tax=Anaerococcus sp. Marseille-P9784 TaxID=2614127 RepID=UPI00124ACC05|nr:septum formation initiator family protein [Anaerococcus sp. Marseille-P9784]